MAATLKCPETEMWGFRSFPLNLDGLVTLLGVIPCDLFFFFLILAVLVLLLLQHMDSSLPYSGFSSHVKGA